MAKGIWQRGLSPDLLSSLNYRSDGKHEVAIFYGLALGLGRILAEYRETGRKAIYIDLGYWDRHLRDRFDGFHKLALNSRHPTDYFQDREHPADRLARHKVTVAPWRKEGRHILVVGMSAKAALAEGLGAQQWERETIAALTKVSSRPILYRPKPNWPGSSPIPGSTYAPKQTLDQALANCHAVVAHHSNVAVDALLAGVPCICPGGVASRLSGHALDQVDDPPMPDGREQWAADLAYTQYSIAEMREGIAWDYLDKEVLT